ncbi:hypothetical protein V6N11_080029 [Hibiscus sabdariffa]|uniref:Disease resistance protein n=1 Tax=Hibiscus sabdariffa TaxID=183260 RepID=A0ABR2RX54_9ROSI
MDYIIQEDEGCSAVQYFKDLWSKGFVQAVEDRTTYYLFKIHDLALDVSQAECLTIYQQTTNASENVRHLAFADRYPLRTPHSFLKKMKGAGVCVDFQNQSLLTLRLLDIPYLQVPDKLQRLINLRFLEITAADMQLREVRPEELRIVSCEKINLLMEPQGIEDQNLHLSLSYFLRDLPRLLLEASVGHLESIQIRHCPNFEAFPD